MSKLRNVRTEINKMRRELEAREAELRKEKLALSIEVISEVLLDDEAVCNVLDGYSKDEIRVIAKHVAVSMIYGNDLCVLDFSHEKPLHSSLFYQQFVPTWYCFAVG